MSTPREVVVNGRVLTLRAPAVRPFNDQIIHGDNLAVLSSLPAQSVQLVYMDPPFNTGKVQKRNLVKHGEVVGESSSYEDSYDDFPAFLMPRIEQAKRLLKPNGSVFVHLDYREVHYIKVELDKLFGRECFMNEIIWAYDYGGRSKSKWSAKHDNILWYVNNPKDYVFNFDAMERIPYMAPELVGAEKAEKGKTLTDTWWHTIVPTMSKERKSAEGYPTQKPVGILKRIIEVHSNQGDTVLDCFGGSGTTGVSAKELDRRFILIDKNPDAVNIMSRRLGIPVSRHLP